MPFQDKVTLPGSNRDAPPNSQRIGPVPPDETVLVTVILRRRTAHMPVTGQGVPVSHEVFAERYGASPADAALVERFAHEYQLTVADISLSKRQVQLVSTVSAFQEAFSTDLLRFQTHTGQQFRGRTGILSIPQELSGVVIAVLGLDNRAVARAHFRVLPQAAASTSFNPPQVAALYDYPTGVDGTGQTIGIIELGGGYSTSDLQTYFSGLGIKQPNVTAVSVDGATNSPGSDADAEVMLDIEVAGSIAPGANIAVYFAPNTDQGFIDAVTNAVHDTTRNPSVVSISWGGPEDSWTQQSQTALNAAIEDAATLGVTVTVACGDSGSSDGESDGKLHVDFPASSPYSLACGGTTLQASGNTINSEVVWNETASGEGATGGGVSNVFPLPSYQSSAGVPVNPETNFAGRGTPDVAGNADPTTGYNVRFDGQDAVVGGTSAVAPLWAALVALINQKLGTSAGYLNPKLYPLGESPFHDITSGNNDDSGLGYYSAGPGWDACTGLGSPDGTAIADDLGSGASGAASGQ